MIMTYGYRNGTVDRGRRCGSARQHDSHGEEAHHADPPVGPAKSVLLGVPYYGYDWPVTVERPERHRPDRTRRPTVPCHDVTYASARDFLAAHPEVARQYDAARGQRLLHVLGADQEDVAAGLLRRRAEPRPRSTTTRSPSGWPASGSGRSTTTAATRSCGTLLRTKFYAPVHAVTVGRVRHRRGVHDPGTSRPSSTTTARTSGPSPSAARGDLDPP